MFVYQVISENTEVPVMDGLGDALIQEGPTLRDGGRITFASGYSMNPGPYEPAVGHRCRVVRTSDDSSEERGGAVHRLTPRVVVDLDGGGWH